MHYQNYELPGDLETDGIPYPVTEDFLVKNPNPRKKHQAKKKPKRLQQRNIQGQREEEGGEDNDNRLGAGLPVPLSEHPEGNPERKPIAIHANIAAGGGRTYLLNNQVSLQ